MQTGLLWAQKRQFVSPSTLHDLKPYWPFAVHTQTFSCGNRALLLILNTQKQKTNANNVLGTNYLDLGMFRLVSKT